MDQIFQLQNQIQRLRQEINNISQLTSQLQQFEQNNAAQLQRLQQHEVNASQQLQRIQQACNQINNDLNLVSSAAQQATSAMAQGGMQFGTGYITAGYSQQPGTFGSQFTPTHTGIYGTTQYYQPNYTTAMPMQQQRFGTGMSTGTYQTPGFMGYAQTFASPSMGTAGYASNQMGAIQNYGSQFQNQSYAQNQQISQQAQQALMDRMNQNMGQNQSQSFAQNQQLSQQAQQAFANRMNQNMFNQNSQFGQTYQSTF